MILRDAIEVNAPAEAIFAFFERIDEHYLRWHPDHLVFRWTRGRGLAVGNRAYFEEVIGGKLMKKEIEYTRIEPGRAIEFVPVMRLMRWFLPSLSFRFESIHEGLWRVVAEIHLRVGPLGEWLNKREFAAVREHMRVEGVNLKRMVEAFVATGQWPIDGATRPVARAQASDERASTEAHEADVQRRVDARCLEHQLTWMRRSIVGLPIDLLWAALATYAGLAMVVWLPWLIARLVLHVSIAWLAPRWVPLVDTDPVRGLCLARRWFVAMGLLHAALMPFFYFGTDDNTKLLAMALGSSYFGGMVVSASGQQRAFWAMVLPSYAIYIAGWLQRGGWLGWGMVLLLLHSMPLIIVSIRQQRRSWEALVRLADDRERLAASLAAERDRAEAASASRTRFFAAASHDLRQPLHALSINATTLGLVSRRSGDPLLIELSQGIDSALRQSRGLLDGLLDISRLDAHAVQLQLAPHDIGTLLEAVRTEYAALAAQRGLSIDVDSAARSGAGAPWVLTDADQLLRILGNLVDNAIKFTLEGGIRLSAMPASSGRVQVCVSDTGPGIAEAERERVFEEFYQIGNPSRDRARGLGLGLAIVKRTAALLDITMQLTGNPGGGVTVELGLAAAPSGVPMPSPVNEPIPVRALSVLLVDDEPDVLTSLCTYLHQIGWAARGAAGGDEAEKILVEGFRADVLVVDFRLRGETGQDVIERLRAFNADLPVVIVTGDTAAQRLRELAGLGANVLHKPIDGARLARALSEAVEFASAPPHRQCRQEHG